MDRSFVTVLKAFLVGPYGHQSPERKGNCSKVTPKSVFRHSDSLGITTNATMGFNTFLRNYGVLYGAESTSFRTQTVRGLYSWI